MSINKVGRIKLTRNNNKIGTKINISNSKNEITAILYNKETELDANNFSAGSLQKNIYKVEKNLPNGHKITKTLISQNNFDR